MSANIFISFAGQDLKVAFTLCKALESRGFKCWISSRDILPGENFQVAIVRAIRTAKMMLLVFTGNSNNSEEMTKELALASQHKLIVIPLRIEDVVANDAFAYEFATRQWIDFFADWEAAINQLSERIAQAIPVEAEAGPTPAAEPAPPPNPHLEPVAIPPAALEPHPGRPRPEPAAPAAVAPAVVAPPATPTKEAAVATIERPPAAELKQPDVPAAPEPAKAKDAAAPAAPAAKSAPVKPAAPVAKAPEIRAPAAAPGEKKKAPVGLLVGIGVVVLALIGAGLFAPSMLAKKPPAPAPAVVAASHPNPAAPATPAAVAAAPAAAPAGVVTPPATPASNALAAAAAGNTLADANAAPHPRRPHPKVTEHHDTEVPF